MVKQTGIQAACGLLLLAYGAAALCAQKFPDYPVRQPSDYSISARQEGVSIGIEPVEAVHDQLTYFHTALSPKGFLAVFVVIHNSSTVDSLLLEKSGILYGLDSSNGRGPKERSPGQNTAFVTTALIPWIGPFIAGGIMRDASEVKQNLVVRELQSGTLSPGATVHGFLYVPIPKKAPRPRIRVQIPIAWTASEKTSILSLEL
ncbi:MAG TPA: hypothetical protein VJX73_08020 [Terracidiphilus sp.]|nr:hypothetical protein [Terracidiphilus sp.]